MEALKLKIVTSALGVSSAMTGFIGLSSCTGACGACFGCAGAGIGLVVVGLFSRKKAKKEGDDALA